MKQIISVFGCQRKLAIISVVSFSYRQESCDRLRERRFGLCRRVRRRRHLVQPGSRLLSRIQAPGSRTGVRQVHRQVEDQAAELQVP